jgi:predicted phosphodiesterase
MRIAIISDIHEDIVSLKKVIGKIEKAGADQLVCLGDIAGFSSPYYNYNDTRDAHACISLIREKCSFIVAGNHDFHAAKRIPKESAVFDFPDNWYSLNYPDREKLSDNEIWLQEDDLESSVSMEDLEFLGSLPEYCLQEFPDFNILFSHYIFPNLSGFKKGFPNELAEFTSHFEFMHKMNCTISITGHTHIRGFYSVSDARYKEYSYRKLALKNLPLCIGIPPVTTNHNSRGFCIFDTEKLIIKAYRC